MPFYNVLVHMVSESINTLNSFTIVDIPFFDFIAGIAFFSLLISYLYGG